MPHGRRGSDHGRDGTGVGPVFDFSRHRRVLDVGGGTRINCAPSSVSIARWQRLYDAPAVAALARQRLAESPLATRLRIVEGDFFTDPLPEDADAVLIANVFHNFLPERNRAVLQRVWASAPDGARLLLVDFGPTRPIRSPSRPRSWRERFCS